VTIRLFRTHNPLVPGSNPGGPTNIFSDLASAPGEEAQVDYGSGPIVRDPQTGKYRRTRPIVLTLGYSRKSVRLLAWRSSARIWKRYSRKFQWMAVERMRSSDNIGDLAKADGCRVPRSFSRQA
jgi:hypothetical protein